MAPAGSPGFPISDFRFEIVSYPPAPQVSDSRCQIPDFRFQIERCPPVTQVSVFRFQILDFNLNGTRSPPPHATSSFATFACFAPSRETGLSTPGPSPPGQGGQRILLQRYTRRAVPEPQFNLPGRPWVGNDQHLLAIRILEPNVMETDVPALRIETASTATNDTGVMS